MPTTLAIPSFADINLVERTSLDIAPAAAATALTVSSTQGFSANQPAFVGTPGIEGSEIVTVDAVSGGIVLTLTAGLALAHSRFDPVIGLIGEMINIYRADNVDGTVPNDTDFAVIGTRAIDADQQTTYYTDSTGSSDYWYKFTYYNSVTTSETDLEAADGVRGDDFGHYASLSEIRTEAGFENAYNLKDGTIDQQRRAAEAEINSTLRSAYTVPFARPVPQKIRYITIKLAAGFLLQSAYHGQSTQGDTLVKDARAQLSNLQGGSDVLDDDTVTVYDGQGVESWPNASTADTDVDEGGGSRSFQIGDVY